MILLYIAAGGAFGSIMRYLAIEGVSHVLGRGFPYGTMIVNIMGGLLMGLLIAWLATIMPRGRELHALLAVGALGGFTTFSAFSYETYLLFERGELLALSLYVGGSVILSVAAFWLGMWLMRSFAL